jgi:hypothetical protein
MEALESRHSGTQSVRNSGWKDAGLARAGAGERMEALRFAALDLGVGRDSGWKLADLS